MFIRLGLHAYCIPIIDHSEKVWLSLSRRFFNSIKNEFCSHWEGIWSMFFRTLVLFPTGILMSISRKCFDFIRAGINVHSDGFFKRKDLILVNAHWGQYEVIIEARFERKVVISRRMFTVFGVNLDIHSKDLMLIREGFQSFQTRRYVLLNQPSNQTAFFSLSDIILNPTITIFQRTCAFSFYPSLSVWYSVCLYVSQEWENRKEI